MTINPMTWIVFCGKVIRRFLQQEFGFEEEKNNILALQYFFLCLLLYKNNIFLEKSFLGLNNSCGIHLA